MYGINLNKKIGRATFWSIFSQTHLVTLTVSQSKDCDIQRICSKTVCLAKKAVKQTTNGSLFDCGLF
jgi:hypothetical protein